MTKTMELATAYESWMIDLRRHFHAHPEVSLKEYKTAEKICEELENLGIPYERVGETGVIATIQGAHEGKTVALRSDIDALSVQEESDISYCSKEPGVMHACGHDAHAAINLGAARILNEMKDEIHGTVLCLFQAAEEVALGAIELIEKGDLFNRVDNFFGAHVWSGLETGMVSVEAGQRMAACDQFTITVTGTPGHGATPDLTVDATVCAAAIIMNLQTLVSREFSPMDSVVVTVGKMTSGTRFNVISGMAVLEGTIRFFTREIEAEIEQKVRRVVEHTAAAYRATAEMVYDRLTPPLINDKESSEIAIGAANKTLGEGHITLLPKTAGSEDFAFYLKEKPGAFAFIGTRNEALKTDYPHHSGWFNIDEAALKVGSALYAQYAIDYLDQNR